MLDDSDALSRDWFDRASLVRTDTARYEVWSKDSATHVSLVLKLLAEYDCAGRRQRGIQAQRLEPSVNSEWQAMPPTESGGWGKWSAIPPDGPSERIHLAICGYAASRNLPIVRR